MKKNRNYLLKIFGFIFIVLCFSNIKINAVNIELPEVHEFQVNDIPVYYINESLPQFSIFISTGYGYMYETKDNAGISDLLCEMIKIDGSKNYHKDKLYDFIDKTGARFSVSSSFESLTISLRIKETYFKEAMGVLFDLINNPAFEQSSLELVKSRFLQQINERKDDPVTLAFDNLRKIIFKNHGYGSVMSKESISSIDLNECYDVWKKIFVNKNIRVGIVSSVPLEQIKTYLNKYLAEVKKGEKLDYKNFVKINNNLNKKIFFYEKNIPQSVILLGTYAPAFNLNDYYNFEVSNYIFGGSSFNSWLLKEIRVKRGLAYSSGSGIRMRKHIGMFYIYAMTNYAKTFESLTLIEDLFKIFPYKVSNDDLIWAKNYLLNSYIFEFDSTISILSKYLYYDLYELSPKIIYQYEEGVKKVNIETIKNKWQKLLKQGYIIVIVGNKLSIQHLPQDRIVKIN